MPNISNTSRSYQSAVRHTPVTESISGSASTIQHFSRSRWLRASECSRYTTSKRGSAGSQSTAVMPLNLMNFCWSFRYRQTSTIRAGSIQSVGSLRSAWPPVMASGRAASIAAATAWSFNMSGSISFGYLDPFGVIGTAFRRVLRPVQRALLPDIEKSGQDENHEQQHLHEPKHLQLAVDDGPGIEKNCFDVEKDEDDGHQIKLHAESLASRACGGDAGFVGRVLHPVSDAFAQQKGDGDQGRRYHNGDHRLHDHREVRIRI